MYKLFLLILKVIMTGVTNNFDPFASTGHYTAMFYGLRDGFTIMVFLSDLLFNHVIVNLPSQQRIRAHTLSHFWQFPYFILLVLLICNHM